MTTAITELDKETQIFFEYFEKVMLNNAEIYQAFPLKVRTFDNKIARFEYGVGNKKTVIELRCGHAGAIYTSIGLSTDGSVYVREHLFNFNGEKVMHYEELEESACKDMKIHKSSIFYIVKLVENIKQIFGKHYHLYYEKVESPA
ncbi:MAG: hypothetical protein ABIP51_17305 [Bacteroidia bacterium]